MIKSECEIIAAASVELGEAIESLTFWLAHPTEFGRNDEPIRDVRYRLAYTLGALSGLPVVEELEPGELAVVLPLTMETGQ